MEFPQVLDYLKHAPNSGAKITRSGWNGARMFVCLQTGNPKGVAINKNTAEATGLPEAAESRFLPYLMFKTAGRFLPMGGKPDGPAGNGWEIQPCIIDIRLIDGHDAVR